MPKRPVFINGKQRDWNSIEIAFLGGPVIGITDISYSVTQKKSDNYGAGPEPIGYGVGQKMYTGGSMNLYEEEIEAMEIVSPDGDILNIPPATISISMSEDNGTNFKVKKLKNVRLTSNPFSSKAGDTSIMRKVTFDFAGVE